MSGCTCKHLGKKLPDNHTCGSLCAEFPACLPPLSLELAEEITRGRAFGESERRVAERTTSLLELLGEAIEEGLGKRNGEGRSYWRLSRTS